MDEPPPSVDLRFSTGDLRRVEVKSRWVGLADPPSREAELLIARRRHWLVGGVQFIRSVPGGWAAAISATTLDLLFEALARPLVSELDPSVFPPWVPSSAWEYQVLWTDDYPSHHFRFVFSGGAEVNIHTTDQKPFMLPLWITPPRANFRVNTYDPCLSIALAELLPYGYLDKDRLAGTRYRTDAEEG